jgi:predicted ATPase
VIVARCATWAQRGQFLHAEDAETWPDGTITARYAFRHALYQEVVYERISSGRLVRLHYQLGIRKEAAYGRRVAEIAAELAVHFIRGRDPQLAIRHLLMAGENALQRSAHQEAIVHLTTGLELLDAIPDIPGRIEQELAFRIHLGPVLLAARGFGAPEVGHNYTRAYELSQQIEDSPEHFPALWGLWQFYNDQAGLDTALDLGQQLLEVSQYTEATDLRLQAYHALETTLFWRGDFPAAPNHFQQAQALYDLQQHRFHAFRYGGHDPGVCCHAFMSVALWICGYPDQAQQRSRESLLLAQSVAHPGSLTHAYTFAIRLHVLLRNWQAAYSQIKAMVGLSSERGFAQRTNSGRFLSNWTRAVWRQEIPDLNQLHQDLTTHQSTANLVGLPMYFAQFAQASSWVGAYDRGLAVLSEALDIVNQHGIGDYEAELHRLKGELLLARSPDHEPEATWCFDHALDTARRQQAKSWELRAATSLARLWQSQHKRQEAYDLLAPVYNWFTEGFDTADLIEAKSLLDELNMARGT